MGRVRMILHQPRLPPRNRKRLFLVLYLAIFVSVFILVSRNGTHPPKRCKDEQFSRFIQPPKINGKKFAKQLEFIRNNNNHASNHLSDIVQRQISKIQGMDCHQPNLQCGHQDDCGFGCQLHHRIGCLILSYVTQRPLIHTPDCDGWSYEARWTHVFQPLGSSCLPGNNTMVWKWKNEASFSLLDCREGNSNVEIERKLGTRMPCYPLIDGIPLDHELVDLIHSISQDPFLWVIGQFAKYAMRYNSSFETRLNEWKREIGFSNGFSDGGSPIVGIQIRLTNKVKEAIRLPLAPYLDEVEKYFQFLEASHDMSNNSVTRRVFVASDNTSILPEVMQIHPDWEILGFESHYSQSERSRGLFEIVRDVELLSQCDFVVCGFSSNICRLIHEMQAFKRDTTQSEDQDPLGSGPPLLKSLDGDYTYLLLGHHLVPDRNMKIWKANPPITYMPSTNKGFY